jgi:hypothetical protein
MFPQMLAVIHMAKIYVVYLFDNELLVNNTIIL